MSSCCDTTIAHVQRQRRDATCPTCGEPYFADLTATIPRAPASIADARVHVADELELRPSRRAPDARLTHVEDAGLVRVRRLLTELRPDRNGPLGWAADGAPPAPSGSAWTPALRVQTSVEVPAILPGAFARISPASLAPNFDRGFPGMPDDIRATLRWCQREGTLAAGLRSLYADCAKACAKPEARAKWEALPARDQHAATVVHGRGLVLAAMASWWRETPPVDPEAAAAAERALRSACTAQIAGLVVRQTERAAAATEEALAQVRGRVMAMEGASE
jgi:hypothetical protein